ncbi:MAG: insulinase family protein [Betaproteobacteria bacterium]
MMRPGRCLLPGFLLSTLLAMTAWSAALPPLPPRIKAPTDTAEFRRFVLGNGLRVLLVSDPKFNKSAAALVVETGQIDDPSDREGLAHFLEHMLFLGTDKYPEVGEYGNFIRANGGEANAYTTTDHTNYHFDIRHDAFAGALDRFAQFFVAPSFNADFTTREINAVHNEAMRHLQNDQRRLISVARELYAPGSGESKFSTGNKDTLAGATPAMVRAFFEKHYTSERMALSLAGKASLDELEKLARSLFSPIPRRDAATAVREPVFLPRKAALRLAYVEPTKDIRQLNIEFVVPATRPDFLSKPDELVTQLIAYPGPGGLVELLKQEGLANSVGAVVWERTNAYGSLLLDVNLTEAGQKDYPRVLGLVFGYLDHLRTSPYPAAYFRDRARIAQLSETYKDRGEGMDLAAKLATQALFYPLEVAERATDVWVQPDESTYRKMLAALTPDNALIALMAKGLPTSRIERIYKVPYSYSEDAGDAYQALARPPKVAAFALPGANGFMPGATTLLAERPLPLINEPGISLHYAEDTEFLRPETAIVFRFVPVREMATADSTALLQLYDRCLREILDPAIGDARLAGVEITNDISLEGVRFTITGFGDSSARFATYVADQMRNIKLTPVRFEALKEATMRNLKSYDQTEAYLLARHRRDAISREYFFLPPELMSRTTSATLADVQAFANRFLARGKLEAVIHGHLPPEDAVAAARAIAARIGAQPVAPDALLRRRHLALAAGESVLDAGPIAGANSAYIGDYLLPDDSPRTRAAAVVIANFIGDPFHSELRTKQQLGYIVGSAAPGSLRERYLSFIVQSSTHAPDELRRRAEAFIVTLPKALSDASDAQWATLIAGARSTLEEKPKGIGEKADQFFANAYNFGGDWSRRQSSVQALDTLTREQAAALLATALAPASARRRTVLLFSGNHPAAGEMKATFVERMPWKSTRSYR